MANVYNSMPIVLDTDLTGTSGWRENQTLVSQSSVALQGIRVTKLVLISNTTTSAGNVTITTPSPDSLTLYPLMNVSATIPTNTILYTDEPTDPLTWRDFIVSGLTATGTTLQLWYRV